MENNDKKKLLKKVLILALILLILGVIVYSFLFNKTDRNIYGLWDIDGTTKYEFKKNGIGELKLPLNTYSFKYKIKDNIISIYFDDDSIRDNTYSIEINNDKLVLKETNGENLFELHKETNEKH